jgi:hypothetical protein
MDALPDKLVTNCLGWIHILNRELRSQGLIWVDELFELISGKDWLAKELAWQGYYSLHNCLAGYEELANAITKNIQVVGSIDPNIKSGPAGYGNPRFTGFNHPLLYLIDFENLSAATAPTHEVVITDQLDVAKMDLSTFNLGPISFGDKQVIPPVGESEFSTAVDLRPAQNLFVRINALLNRETGLLTWRFTSIDPATGQPPEDPLVGFLPPDKNPPEGEGSVLFNVMPKSGLATGTEIRNRATIVFDANAPIDTPEWLNTIDNSMPESRVLPLAATQNATSFVVQWLGTDHGAGIRDYTICVSEDGGPFTAWLSNTTGISATFTGQYGKTYSFYSVATDNTGNTENPPDQPDTITTVKVLNHPPVALCKDVVTTADATCKGIASIDDGSYEPDSDPITIALTPVGPYSQGSTVVTLTVTDCFGASNSCSGDSYSS